MGSISGVLDAMFVELDSHHLTHELLVMLMAEMTVIVTAWSTSTIPTDADDPQLLSPSMFLTVKTCPLCPPPGNFLPPDVYAQCHLRHIQYLTDQWYDGGDSNFRACRPEIGEIKEESMHRRCSSCKRGGSIQKWLAHRQSSRSHSQWWWSSKKGPSGDSEGLYNENIPAPN